MPDYRRIFQKGGTYFFTVVTYQRAPILIDTNSVSLLRKCIEEVSATHPFRVDAFVILPDHVHTIWQLPENDCDYSVRWKKIKALFTKRYGRHRSDLPDSFLKKGEKGIWQRRYWEHLIRDQEDYDRHLDYIHYNPVKHNFAISAIDWEASSFVKFVNKGAYQIDWGQNVSKELQRLDFE
jgi:putative transposase